MPFAARLNHVLTVQRMRTTVDVHGDVVLDEYGQPVRRPVAIADVDANIQPKSAREVALLSQAGATVADYTVYLLPSDLTTADALLHDPASCPAEPDLPEVRFEVIAIADSAGLGHHFEVQARIQTSPAVDLEGLSS